MGKKKRVKYCPYCEKILLIKQTGWSTECFKCGHNFDNNIR